MPDAAEIPFTQPSRSGRLLSLIHKLIDYGRELAATIRQRTATDPSSVAICFGTTDLALILASISRGLHRANALEARVQRGAAQLDAAQPPAKARARAAKPPAAVPAVAADPRLAYLPTPAQIAADVRRRPIGATIADICRDFGIMPSHPLWRDVQMAMIEHGGNLARLLMDTIERSFAPLISPPSAVTPGALRGLTLRFEAPGDTRPP